MCGYITIIILAWVSHVIEVFTKVKNEVFELHNLNKFCKKQNGLLWPNIPVTNCTTQ